MAASTLHRASRWFSRRKGSHGPQLAVYSDVKYFVMLLGPKGWKCNAAYGQDASGGFTVHPKGDPVHSDPFAPRWHLSHSSRYEAITAFQSGASGNQSAAETAATYFENGFDRPCPSLVASEGVVQLSPTVVAF
jgi:hypothetical protein